MFRITRRASLLALLSLLTATGGALGVAGAQAAPATPTCTLANLYLSIGQVTGGAGSLFVPVRFTNTSTQTCALRGYPGVSILDIEHHQIGAPATRNPHPVSTVLVHPDQTVTATLRTNSRDVVPACRATSTYVQVFPPASLPSGLIPYRLQVCGTFQVNPVQT